MHCPAVSLAKKEVLQFHWSSARLGLTGVHVQYLPLLSNALQTRQKCAQRLSNFSKSYQHVASCHVMSSN